MRELVKEEDVARRIKTIRTSRGLTLTQVGEKLGKTHSAVGNQEKHPLSMSVRSLMEYADIYGCKVSDFFVPFEHTVREYNVE